MPLDVELARAATPGVSSVCHLNNAGAALVPAVVIDTVIDHLRREATIGGYEAADEARERVDAVYDSVATMLGAGRDEIALVESATTAWNAAFLSIPLQPGDRVLTGRSEYVSNALNLIQAEQRHGIEVVVVEDDAHGQISLDALRAAIDERTRLIALTHVPTSGGLVNPAAEVGAIARDAGVLYVLDACQSAGQMPLDVGELGCDVLSATGRKFVRGPRGTGFLYVRSAVLDQLRPVQIDTRSAVWTSATTFDIAPTARRFESWESSIANRLGLGAAIEHALGWGMAEIEARTTLLAERLRKLLRTAPRVTVHDKGQRRCGIVTFSVEGHAAADVQRSLRVSGVNTSVTTAEVAQYDLPQRGLTSLVRASPHYYNTDDEIARLVEHVSALA